MTCSITSQVIPGVQPTADPPSRVRHDFLGLIEAGARFRGAGLARNDPLSLLRAGYGPKRRLELFDVDYYLTNARQNPDIRFFVAYVVLREGRARRPAIYPRIFYKDISLVWRAASHFVRVNGETWIGKGDVERVTIRGEEFEASKEESTNLPLEIQDALELLVRSQARIPTDHRAVELILRRGAAHRIAAFADFTAAKRKGNRACPINRGRRVARFTRRTDPTSLVFAPGFEPDFDAGVLESGESRSRLYGGTVRRFRILSTNRQAQYLFFAAPRHAWIGDCQATTTEIMSYGVRTVDVAADDLLFIPGFEYHALDEPDDLPALAHQIPPGFTGPVSELDPHRADASPWLDRVPVIRAFRRKVLARG